MSNQRSKGIHVDDLLDITEKVISVVVIGAGAMTPVDAFTDGQHFYFDDASVLIRFCSWL